MPIIKSSGDQDNRVMIPLVIEPEVASTGSYITLKRNLVDFDIFKNAKKATLIVQARKVGGGSGAVRLRDATNSLDLGTLNFSETELTTKKVELTNIPTDGIVKLLARGKTDGVGTLDIEAASMGIIS